ncbi:DUF6069 family protein [Streptomyces griseoviridis]|uniref:Uncharacterized protein n=2 Tax=Streptomyces griseoviridis TaxID=45398 RepID=A0A918G7N3_STRGD|nr:MULTISPECIES: DUF6069 family protein [Streptomyces]MDP9681412.1 hypothetical protein [Streptomyces griseoviridis]GGS21138.1 hypothetical protein GCM10010238_06770 [Streptomyces niveoruber]GGS74769.1 hypothetical protein GCM10010240_04820 [Streptomyces griseoviridis]
MNEQSTARAAGPARPGGAVVAGGLVATAVVAVALNAAVAAIAHAAGASDDFEQLHFADYALLTVVGVLAGAGGWALVRARAARPARVLRTWIPVILLVTFVPDILLGLSDNPGTSWGAVIALMLMHLVVAAVAVPAFRFLLPLPGDRG